jgi:hypothetical protein
MVVSSSEARGSEPRSGGIVEGGVLAGHGGVVGGKASWAWGGAGRAISARRRRENVTEDHRATRSVRFSLVLDAACGVLARTAERMSLMKMVDGKILIGLDYVMGQDRLAERCPQPSSGVNPDRSAL